ncbi:hypothetical protein PC117_g6367 [Phytophthora cactorum]|uniref:Uncharacterized protein n=1 Tax=Phytophthora cactorum TaxID=29920 RepID=A0A8T1E8D9_9STRA|nr:hypothetical protein PC117_g6367 [Phytophthora cactorum]
MYLRCLAGESAKLDTSGVPPTSCCEIVRHGSAIAQKTASRAKCDWSQPTACTPRTGGAADLCAIRLRSNEGDSRVTCLARGTPPQHEWNGERPDSWNTLKCSPPSLDRIGSRVGPALPSGSCRPQGLRMASSELGGAASSGGATTARDKLVPRNACVLDARLQADGRSCS